MSGSSVRVVERRDLLAARRERRRATEASYLAPDQGQVVVHASRWRGVVLGLFLSLALWVAPVLTERVWPLVQRTLVPGG